MRTLLVFVAATLFVASPLSLVLARQVYLDNIALSWLLLAFYLALTPRVALWHHVGAGLCFALAVLSKETTALAGPALMVAMPHRPRWQNRTFSLVGFLTVGGLILAFYPLSALLSGELLAGPNHVSLEDGVRYQLAARPGSGAVWEPGSAKSELVASWLYYDTFVLVAGLAAALVCLCSRRTRWLSVTIAALSAPVLLGSGYLPAMYVIAAVPFLFLAIAAAAEIMVATVGSLGRTSDETARRLTASASVVVATLLFVAAGPNIATRTTDLLTAQENAEFDAALAWVRANVPREDVVVVPYAMWPDLERSGWNGPWSVIAVEKVDLDPEFREHHPRGWREIEWIVEGPSVRSNISDLGLVEAGKALDSSTVVRSFGEWSVRQVRSTS